MNPEQLDALDKIIGDTLASVPTTKENEDHLMAIEDQHLTEVLEDIRCGWITVVEGDAVIKALHERLHPSG